VHARACAHARMSCGTWVHPAFFVVASCKRTRPCKRGQSSSIHHHGVPHVLPVSASLGEFYLGTTCTVILPHSHSAPQPLLCTRGGGQSHVMFPYPIAILYCCFLAVIKLLTWPITRDVSIYLFVIILYCCFLAAIILLACMGTQSRLLHHTICCSLV